MSDLKIESWAIDKIKPYDGNAKIHTEEQVKALAKVIETQGWDVPIVVDKNGVIIKGHGRRLAAIYLKMKKVPVICRRDLSEEEVKAARLSDNRVALGEYDTNLLQQELRELAEADFEIGNLGFSEKELEFLTEDIAALDDSAFDDPPDSEEPPEPSADSDDEIPIGTLFGVKKLPAKYRKPIAHFMGIIEEETGLEGADALGSWIQSLVTDAEAAQS